MRPICTHFPIFSKIETNSAPHARNRLHYPKMPAPCRNLGMGQSLRRGQNCGRGALIQMGPRMGH
eukprot:10108056-Lingulodinium_polyedra.AAC.1